MCKIGKVHKHGDKTSTIRSIPYLIYWMIFFLVRLLHVRITTTWCLHKFPCNVHSHVQQAYLVKGNGTSYVIFGCCWLRAIHVVGSVQIIYPMGDMGVKECGLPNAYLHNVFHNLVFYRLTFLHFSHVHVVSYKRCC